MSCDIQVKIATQSVNQSDLLINTKRIRELTQQIRNVTDCDALKLIIKEHVEELKTLAENAAKQQLKQLEKILPILHLPSPNPISILKWIAKLVTGTAYPQLEAYIKYSLQIIDLLKAITEIITVVESAIPRLKLCAQEIPQELLFQITTEITESINNEVDKLSNKINKEINDAICEVVNQTALSTGVDLLSSVNDIINLVNDVKTLKYELDNAVTTTLLTIGQTQTLITGITGTTPPIDTSSPANFLISINNGALQTLNSDTLTFVQAVAPVNTVLPAITGTESTGSIITCSMGTWTSDTPISFTYQWYRGGSIIDGAIYETYTLIVDDIESSVYCLVTGTNTGGSLEVRSSNSTDNISYATEPGDLPVITGTAQNGSTLICSTGIWPSTPTLYYYEWSRDSVIVKATSIDNSYKLVSADIGHTMTCKVTAIMFKYTLSATSNPTAVVIDIA